jgi:hypothetical protein
MNPKVPPALLQWLAAHTDLLGGQGSVQRTWRQHRGQRLGPYFRLVFRVESKQHSVYLGVDPMIAAEVQTLLQRHQEPRHERRRLAGMIRAARRASRHQKALLQADLARHRLALRGNEIRGWRRFAALANSGG